MQSTDVSPLKHAALESVLVVAINVDSRYENRLLRLFLLLKSFSLISSMFLGRLASFMIDSSSLVVPLCFVENRAGVVDVDVDADPAWNPELQEVVTTSAVI